MNSPTLRKLRIRTARERIAIVRNSLSAARGHRGIVIVIVIVIESHFELALIEIACPKCVIVERYRYAVMAKCLPDINPPFWYCPFLPFPAFPADHFPFPIWQATIALQAANVTN